eukprot:NODE_8502_length_1491_cov_3.088710.p1 GENE.NODE_8502_length_1491_cov_3.088710~~NODE_8502_length_1491_cov_3.088710.p1  ORF type:complete len:434 (-),score=114.57 NODE_8502_length_1491_cov_3.088710:76-1377(-)
MLHYGIAADGEAAVLAPIDDVRSGDPWHRRCKHLSNELQLLVLRVKEIEDSLDHRVHTALHEVRREVAVQVEHTNATWRMAHRLQELVVSKMRDMEDSLEHRVQQVMRRDVDVRQLGHLREEMSKSLPATTATTDAIVCDLASGGTDSAIDDVRMAVEDLLASVKHCSSSPLSEATVEPPVLNDEDAMSPVSTQTVPPALARARDCVIIEPPKNFWTTQPSSNSFAALPMTEDAMTPVSTQTVPPALAGTRDSVIIEPPKSFRTFGALPMTEDANKVSPWQFGAPVTPTRSAVPLAWTPGPQSLCSTSPVTRVVTQQQQQQMPTAKGRQARPIVVTIGRAVAGMASPTVDVCTSPELRTRHTLISELQGATAAGGKLLCGSRTVGLDTTRGSRVVSCFPANSPRTSPPATSRCCLVRVQQGCSSCPPSRPVIS